MKNAVQVRCDAPKERRSYAAGVVVTVDDARRVYLQSPSRLDLATLGRVFKDAPVSTDTSGLVQKRR